MNRGGCLVVEHEVAKWQMDAFCNRTGTQTDLLRGPHPYRARILALALALRLALRMYIFQV
jgi:hypothetical protein